MSSFSAYATASTALLVMVCYHAHEQRRQFYPTVRRASCIDLSHLLLALQPDLSGAFTASAASSAPPLQQIALTACPMQVIHLTSSKVSLLVLGNEALVITFLFGKLCKRLFFGRLRDAEVESLYERSWYAITETCLAMTIFREELNFRFVALFTALLFLKIFHWLMQDRVSYMEQSPATSYATHARMLCLMALLFTLDCAFLHHAIGTSLLHGPSVLLLFAFEYLILASTVCSTFSKYALHVNDLRLGGRWDDKGVYLFYLELITDLFHMLVYLAFFVLICTYYGLPLHIMRDLYLTIRSFRTRVADFIRYRRIAHNMHERFPDATEEELERTDRICIICRENIESGKKLACGHIFHFHCLRSWLERQQTCPTCRAPIETPDERPAAAGAAAAADRAANNAADAHPHAHPHAHPQDATAAAHASAAAAAAAAAAAPLHAVAEPFLGQPVDPAVFLGAPPRGMGLPAIPQAFPSVNNPAGAASAAAGAPLFGGMPPPAGMPFMGGVLGGVPFGGAHWPGADGGAVAGLGVGMMPGNVPAMGMPTAAMGAPPFAPFAAGGITTAPPNMPHMAMGGFGSPMGAGFGGVFGIGGLGMGILPGIPAGVLPPGMLPPGLAPNLFASPFFLPAGLQAPPATSTTAAYLQAQIAWLQQCLDAITPPVSGSAPTPVPSALRSPPSAVAPASPVFAVNSPPQVGGAAGSSAGAPRSASCACNLSDAAHSTPPRRSASSMSDAGAQSSSAAALEASTPISPSRSGEREELRRRRLERLGSSAGSLPDASPPLD